MLKKIRLLFLGLVVIAGSACVSPTHASSAPSVVLTYIQPAGASGAKDELLVIHNNSAIAVDITDWCLVNKYAVAFACFASDTYAGYSAQFILPAYQSVSVGSYEYTAPDDAIEPEVFMRYEVTHQSSGSLVGSADTITLINEVGEVIDSFTWVEAPAKSTAWTRMKAFSSPDIYASSGSDIDWSEQGLMQAPVSGIEVLLADAIEVPDAGSGASPDIGVGSGSGEGSAGGNQDSSNPKAEGAEDTSASLALAKYLVINEIFPNAEGADANKEFIELYNTSSEEIALDNFQLRIGIKKQKWYAFASDMVIPANGYLVLSDTDFGFTLVNTHGGAQLYYGDIVIGEAVEYVSPGEDMSWSLIDERWQYTNQITPGGANRASNISAIGSAKLATGRTKKPCATNQYRNPATGRCKLIATVKTPAPCKVGQVRNPATGRCRKVPVAMSPKPCKEGQERNAETGRCRNIKQMTSVGNGVKGVQTTAGAQLGWYYWLAIVGVVLLVLGYAAWEWRQELLKLWRRLVATLAKK